MKTQESSNKNNILVVEDDEGIRESLKFALELEGYKVVASGNGEEALETLKNSPTPCLILLDLMMPVMDGWEFVAEKDKDPRLSPIPVLVLTAFADKAKTIRSNGVVNKPVDLDTLFNAIKPWCNGA